MGESKSKIYRVVWCWKGGQEYESRCATIPGYTTTDDFPKMIGIKRGYDPADITIVKCEEIGGI